MYGLQGRVQAVCLLPTNSHACGPAPDRRNVLPIQKPPFHSLVRQLGLSPGSLWGLLIAVWKALSAPQASEQGPFPVATNFSLSWAWEASPGLGEGTGPAPDKGEEVPLSYR